jgi:heavy metal sensor kinase
MPIRVRLTVATAAMVAVVLAVAGVVLYLRVRADLIHAVDSGLRSRAGALTVALERPGGGLDPPTVLIETDEAFAQVLGDDGRVLATTDGIEPVALLSPEEAEGVAGPTFLDREVAGEDEPIPSRLLAVPIDGGRVAVVGASLEDQQEALGSLAAMLAVGGPAALALITAIGWLVTGAALRPIEDMRRRAAVISGDLEGQRLPVPPASDEVSRLAVTLNGMLDRLEEAMARERRFVADAGHELRTPLANLRMELELASRRARTSQELEAAVRSAAEETDRLSRLAEDLLVLARTEGGKLPLRRERTDLDDLVVRTVDRFAARTADGGVRVRADVAPGTEADVDPDRLAQALGNLVDNALRHTPAPGEVTVSASRHDGMVRLEVADTGPGFADGFPERAFEPFARPDAGRSRPDGGTGLGLAIVRAVAEAHGGTVTATNGPGGGASVVMEIPG